MNNLHSPIYYVAEWSGNLGDLFDAKSRYYRPAGEEQDSRNSISFSYAHRYHSLGHSQEGAKRGMKESMNL